MKNGIQMEGKIVTLTAPSGGVVSGQAVKVGQLFGIVIADTEEADLMEVVLEGVFEVPKKTADTLSEGSLVYWDDTEKEVTTTAASNLLVGAAIKAAGNTATTAEIRLNGIARATEAGA